VAVVNLVGKLVTGQHYLLRVDDYHEITAIHVGRKQGLVFSAKDRGDLGSYPAENLVFHIDQEPIPCNIIIFGHERFHITSQLDNKSISLTY